MRDRDVRAGDAAVPDGIALRDGWSDRIRRGVVALFVFGGLTVSDGTAAESRPVIPLAGPSVRPVVPATTLVLANRNDPESVRLAGLYAERRGIPAGNIVEVALDRRPRLTRSEFRPILEAIRAEPAFTRARAVAIAWAMPYAVEAQSITSAVTEGLAPVTWTGVCVTTMPNPLHARPVGIDWPRPLAMLLIGGPAAEDSLALAGRAGAGDGADWPGTIYLVATPDRARSLPREATFSAAERRSGSKIRIERPKDGAELRDRDDVLGYQIGLPRLQELGGLRFRAGAYADSLTSNGGRLFEPNDQTPLTAFLKAGATASFGTVTEPCNFPQKFPDPDTLLDRYLGGDTIVEAYWKSVAWATEGLFAGEPLARPFQPLRAEVAGGEMRLMTTRQSRPGRYALYRVESGAPVPTGIEVAVPPGAAPSAMVATVPDPGPGTILGLVEVSAR